MPDPAQARGRVAQVVSRPPPIGGLNLIDSLAGMPITDAIVLENYVARGNSIELRRGFSKHSVPPVVAIDPEEQRVETLMAYNGVVPKLFAVVRGAASGVVFDCRFVDVTEDEWAVPAGSVVATSARWEHVNVSTAGGQFLLAVNALNRAQIFDGTTWQQIDGASSPIAITGVDTTTLSNITLHVNRVWFSQRATLVAFYLGINSVGGAAAAFDLRTVAKLGGSIVAIDTWTIDTGEGADDHMVFITSEGEVIVYTGTDPASVDTWSLKGVYRIGRPSGRRCTLKLRGDLLILCEGGIIAMGTLLQQGADRRDYITYKIQPELSRFTKDFSNFGFEMIYFQSESLLILNTPESPVITRQYAVDVNTPQAWGPWTGIQALCFELFQGIPYIGMRGNVAQLWSQDSDDGASIPGRVKPAFSKYEHEERKNERKTRVYFSSAGGLVKFGIRVNRDFEDRPPETANLTAPVPGVGVWGQSLWGFATWGAGVNTPLRAATSEIAAAVIGTYLTPYIVTNTKDIRVQINGSDHVYEAGGFT